MSEFTYTYAAVKPGAYAHADSIVTEARDAGFGVRAIQPRRLPRALAEEFYEEHVGKPFFEGLIDHMVSGPIVALILTRPSSEAEPAWKQWREFIGPTNVQKAKDEAPQSIRARFGGEGTGNNAVHGSDSTESAAREVGLIFPHLSCGPLGIHRTPDQLIASFRPPRAVLLVRADAPDGVLFSVVSSLRKRHLCAVRAVSVGLSEEDERTVLQSMDAANASDDSAAFSVRPGTASDARLRRLALLRGAMERSPTPAAAFAADDAAAMVAVVVTAGHSTDEYEALSAVGGDAPVGGFGAGGLIGNARGMLRLTSYDVADLVAEAVGTSTPLALSGDEGGDGAVSRASHWCSVAPLTADVEACVLTSNSSVGEIPTSAMTMTDDEYHAAHPEVAAAAAALVEAAVNMRSAMPLTTMAAVLARAVAVEVSNPLASLLGRWSRVRGGRTTRYTFLDPHNVALDRGDGQTVVCTYAVDARRTPFAMDIVMPLPPPATSAGAPAAAATPPRLITLKCIFDVVDCVLRWEGVGSGERPTAFSAQCVELIKEEGRWPCAL